MARRSAEGVVLGACWRRLHYGLGARSLLVRVPDECTRTNNTQYGDTTLKKPYIDRVKPLGENK